MKIKKRDSHGKLKNGHGKVMEKYFVKSVGTLQSIMTLLTVILPLASSLALFHMCSWYDPPCILCTYYVFSLHTNIAHSQLMGIQITIKVGEMSHFMFHFDTPENQVTGTVLR